MRRDDGSVSVVVAAIVLVVLVLSLGLADLARVVVARSHARTAADAAALAVAQELALPTGRDLSGVATEYAGRNGATLEACECEPGTFDATVSVAIAVDGLLLLPGDRTVVARARAVVERPGASSPGPA